MTRRHRHGDADPGVVLMAHPGGELYGSDRMFLESVQAMTDAGARVWVALSSAGPLAAMLRDRGADATICRSPVLRKSALSPRGFLRLVACTFGGIVDGWHLLSRVKPDRVYVSTVTVPLWIVLARLRGIPVLCHVHEAEASAPAVVRAAIAAPLLLAENVIANSRFSVAVLGRSFRSIARRAVLVHNGVPGPVERMPAREQLDGILRIAYVGRLSPRKGVDVVVDAVGQLAARGVRARLDVIGTVFAGYEWYEQELRERAERLGADDAVRFHGFVPSVWALVAESDVVVVPSRHDEPFGNTAVEALLCGRPVIASGTSGLLEATAGFAAARTVTPGDPVALADALESVSMDWAQLREAAWRDVGLVDRRHDPALYRQTIADLMLSMQPRHGRRAPVSPASPAFSEGRAM
ncbi:glycosyltransferase family 4 protein [Salinibacterium sp. dk2585]|uniref:glycosyltransferase family 4 protein n=1 Tax=unclassified Salinibacterium TaxID=2632331 RepID=UPI0011C2427C|nr:MULTISPECIES: glycosyltransferase family 4 protein [unclassified Salinibacterium]QEE62510.1 glycosyltransferase family 4 protein [Salinibacterium sp. dk2585]TXK56088.1 glycosyltransferase family 4 protein [Salinibacterium sp. dk5596]